MYTELKRKRTILMNNSKDKWNWILNRCKKKNDVTKVSHFFISMFFDAILASPVYCCVKYYLIPDQYY